MVRNQPMLTRWKTNAREKARRKSAMDTQRTTIDEWSEVPGLLASLYQIAKRLRTLFPERKFTPDGHLVGSIGEAIAARMFELRLLNASTKEHDATTADGRTLVQIKLTQGNGSIGLRGQPQHLLVLRLARDLALEIVYNGGGQGPWSAAGKMQTNGQRQISLSRLRAMNSVVPECNRLPVCNEVDLRR